MRALLLYPDRDVDLLGPLPGNEKALVKDLELESLFDAMSLGDRFLMDVVRKVVFASLTAPDTIRYRQQVLADCLERPTVVRDLYSSVAATIEGSRKRRFGLYPGASPGSVLSASVPVLEFQVDMLMRFRETATREASAFVSPGFSRLFAMIQTELDDAYFKRIADQLSYLKFRRGVPNSAELGQGNKGVRYVLRRAPRERGRGRWLSHRRRSSASSFEVNPRDDAGLQTLAQTRSQGLNEVANALAQSADHILSFLAVLRAELGFYVGCLNLHDRLAEKGERTCFPTPLPLGERASSARGLYDVCLTLHVEGRIVGNDVDIGDRTLVMITGANQGGKSTLLRSLGLAHLLMQCGMFVAAEAFSADVRDGLFTHFKREEDASMESGKLDEELRRMSAIVDSIGPDSLLLCNESFASTNEREGSEIARQVVRALGEIGIKVFFVTHLFDLADSLYREDGERAVFLRAQRLPNGERTFQVVPGAPLPTSHGQDLFERILGRPSPPFADHRVGPGA
jgi:DNA mismatch repair ATPase MutS